MAKEVNYALFNSIKGGLTKRHKVVDVDKEKIETLKDTVKMLGIDTKATTIKGLQDAIKDHANKAQE